MVCISLGSARDANATCDQTFTRLGATQTGLDENLGCSGPWIHYLMLRRRYCIALGLG